MDVRTATVGDIDVNTYILQDEQATILIDPGADYAKIKNALQGRPCTYVLLTHAHYDHIGAVQTFQREGARVYLHRDDMKLLSGHGHLASLFAATLESFTPDVLLDGGETLDIGGMQITVLSTPGHTDGSVCFITENMIFSGDTLFYLSVGRTDFPSGDARKLHDSLVNKLFRLEGEYKVLPGHGQSTFLSFEKKYNPYV